MAEQKEQGANLSRISSGPRNLPSPSTERCPPPPCSPPLGLNPRPLPTSPTPLFPAAEGRAERAGCSPYLGRVAGPAPARRLGPSPGGARAGVGGTRRRERGQAQPWSEVAGLRRGIGAQGLPLPGTRSWLRSVSRPRAGLCPRSAPFSQRGWAGACITVTSPPLRSSSGARGAPAPRTAGLEQPDTTWHFERTQVPRWPLKKQEARGQGAGAAGLPWTTGILVEHRPWGTKIRVTT
ncbi:translation initiation factor IF-2-like [Orcinus orca]|uniref:translation initiation factor IF-2-like n=1 Tax=Orcinus orca TaxID=9733 RepID=UPI00211125FD|nr:translation initiation factor IF-2-like [Orcinus orca]